jgi:hypothetical protein
LASRLTTTAAAAAAAKMAESVHLSYIRRVTMLSTEKISQAFEAIAAICDELQDETDIAKVQAALKTIHSIAKHQSDIRSAPKGSCKAHPKTA